MNQEELVFLQSQLEGLESIFLELIPSGIDLKRQQIQDYYDKRFGHAKNPHSNVAGTELRRQFNSKANNVRNLVDTAESFGSVTNKLNLIHVASSLPNERLNAFHSTIAEICIKILQENLLVQKALDEIINNKVINAVEARTLLGSIMFLIVDELKNEDSTVVPVYEVLGKLIQFIGQNNILEPNDPFLIEAQCALEAMQQDNNQEQ